MGLPEETVTNILNMHSPLMMVIWDFVHWAFTIYQETDLVLNHMLSDLILKTLRLKVGTIITVFILIWLIKKQS